MRYTPQTDLDKQRMLQSVGLETITDLVRHVPQSLRERAAIGLPAGLSEPAVLKRLTQLAARNATPADWAIFVGGGIYRHFVPAAVDAVISRSEFSTSYTPYQPEVSQGTLQALYEYQTLICQLTAMDVSNAGVYDGASAAAEAVLMARRIQPSSRRRVLISRALHPQYRAVIATYLRNLTDVELEEIPFDASGATDLDRLTAALNERVMCVVVGYPNFFGVIEDLGPIGSACAERGAHLLSVTAEALALPLLKPPGDWGVDIAVGEGQSLGIPMNLGGPAFGFFSCRKKFVRSMPGRLVGETVDNANRRGFVLTLATREQHIRREKATSNICTSQTLCTLAATVFMSLMGRTGMRRLAEISMARAHEVCERMVREADFGRRFGGPFFNEFVLRGGDLDQRVKHCVDKRILPGAALSAWYPELTDCLLVCATEMTDTEEIERLVTTIRR